jgi:hypothetical protein
MPLSRLENFLKNVEGNILYVNPTDLDATDSIENQGNSLTKPFKTIQRALLEAARFSYQIGQNNDKFDRTTVLLYPGTHEIDNRPGYSVVVDPADPTAASYRDRNGTVQTLSQLTNLSNYNLDDSGNELHKFNSVEGGVIIPRGVSLVGLDLRKTKIRPKFVPDPTNDAVTNSSIFRLTGGTYFWQFTVFDADPTGSAYKDYTTNRYSPNFSHHKLTAFEYADGVNGVGIGTSSATTDLQMYYHKVQRAYGDSSGRAIGDFPGTVDMQSKLPEYQIVAPLFANNVGISSIKAGAGSKTNTSTTITVDCSTSHGLVVDSPIRISGINTYPTIYNGNFTVTGVSSDRIFTYQASSAPLDGLPDLVGDEVVIADTDSVSGASPYVFNISMRSTYGMNGMHADGSKATGFKSMVVAQFTGVSLQKDDNAFLYYNSTTGQYDNVATVDDSQKPLYLNSSSIYKPSYENYHIKCSNDSFIQTVSVFAIGYAKHFIADSGGDMSITNSNSNFGAKSLASIGFKDTAYDRDNRGYITHIVPPQSQVKSNKTVEWLALNVGLTTAPVGVGTTAKLFLDGFTDPDVLPPNIVDGYRIGGMYETENDHLYVTIAGVGTFRSPIRMLNPDGSEGDIGAKQYKVGRVGAANSISNSVITFTTNHKLYAGESVRVIADDGYLPDGIDTNEIYYAVTNDSQNESLTADQIKLARSENEAILGGSGNFITIDNNLGGVLTVVSRVTDKIPGSFGHPIQYDEENENWYVRGGITTSSNELWQQIVNNQVAIGPRTGKTFFRRREDTRSLTDKIYKLRYVIPKEIADAKPPVTGYSIAESSTVGVTTASDFTNTIPSVNVQRNLRILKSVDRSTNTGITTVVTEKPHNFVVGDKVHFANIYSSTNTVGAANSGYNVTKTVVGITSSKGFEVLFGVADPNPGTFTDTVSIRNQNLPTVSRKEYKDSYTIYRVETLKPHEYNKQDGVYHLTCVDSSISPVVNEFSDNKFNQQIEDLYPQFDANNFNMDPHAASSFAVGNLIGQVVTNDLKKSITKEFANNFLVSNRIGYAVTGAVSSSSGVSTVFTNVQHNFNSIITLGTPTAGTGYGPGVSTTLYNVSLTGGSGEGATANVVVSAAQTVTSLTIVDGGSAYVVGDSLTINAGNADATVSVSAINNNIGDALQIVGVGTSGNRYNSGYSGIHTITALTSKSVTYNVGSNPGVYVAPTTGIHTGFFFLAGDAPGISTIAYTDRTTGIVTVTTTIPHGLNVNNPFKIVGVAQTIYNGEFIVNERVGINTFTFKFTEDFVPTAYVSGGNVLPIVYGAHGGLTRSGDEKIGQRHVPFVAGISTTIDAAGISTTSTTLILSNSSGFYKGDYAQIDGEIIRIASDFTSNQATVLRGQLGSRTEKHDGTSVIKKIRVIPTENRRYSILRASGHTFEYLGYGPGNYSTGMPQKQDRVLTRIEQFLSQSIQQKGGSVVYTGMNDAGDFYIGNRRVSSLDGTETTFQIPVPTVTGADATSDATSGRLDVIFDSVNVREGLVVDGINNTTVKLNAPTQVTEKLTSTSDDGVEVVFLDISAGLDQARTITYSGSKPTAAGIEGDLVFSSTPTSGGYLGWVYTSAGWKRFGLVSTEGDETRLSLNSVGVGSTSASRIGSQSGLDVRGQIVADNLSLTGISTFSGTTTFQDVTFQTVNVSVAGTAADWRVTGNARVGAALTVTGIATFSNNVRIAGNLTVDGDLSYDELTGRNLRITGVSTVAGLNATGINNVGVITSRNILPEADSTYTLGSNLVRWSNGYFDTVTVAETTINTDGVNVAVGDTYYIGGTPVLSGSTLHSGITSSFLTAVGNLSSLSVANNVIVDGGTLFVNASTNRVGVNTLTPGYALDVVGDINISSGSFFKINGAVLTSGYLQPITEGKAVGLTTAAGLGVAVGDAGFIGNGSGRASFQVGAGSSVFFVGAGSTARVGIGSTIPRATFDLAGKMAINGDPQWVDTYGVIKQSRNTIAEDVTIPASHNGVDFNSMSVGPIIISSGFTVTVDTDATWAII